MSTAKRARRGRPPGITLTPTDHAVIAQIAAKGFQDHKALRKSCLATVSPSHSWVILKRLVKADYLYEDSNGMGRINGWTLSERTRRVISKQDDAPIATKYAVPIYRNPYRHNALLLELQDTFSKVPSFIQWTPEHVIKADTAREFQLLHVKDQRAKMANVPDAMIHFKSTNGKIRVAALELELTPKTKRRIYKKIEAHISNPAFNWAVFVVGNEALFKLYWNTYLSVIENSLQVRLLQKQNGIYFALLENLQRDQLSAILRSPNHSFALSQL